MPDPLIARSTHKGTGGACWLLRHGERADEAEGPEARAWRSGEGRGERWFDPPLTERGREQAREAARKLAAVHARCPFSEVLVSPLLRTLQTAEEVVGLLGDGSIPVRVVPGLSFCAAAVKKRGYGGLAIRTREEVLQLCPKLAVAAWEPASGSFEEACASASASEGGSLCITHREGIRDLSEIAGHRITHTPYCCAVQFVLGEAGQWGVDPESMLVL
mmetsp:Transcript_482/g.1356  ORF Transcript_482/g.1356 Transcript_482/m.1356 type:complete len:218 (+) Transcript_482:4976-5629(+)